MGRNSVGVIPSDNEADILTCAIGNMVATFLPYKTHKDRSLRQLTPTANTYDNSDYYPQERLTDDF